MKKHLSLFTIVILFTINTSAQVQFQRISTSVNVSGFFPKSDGGFISSGMGFYQSGWKVELNKFDSLGNLQWSKKPGTDSSEIAYAVKQLFDGGFIITGQSGNLGAENVFLMRTDSLGNPIWFRIYGGATSDIGFDVKQTSDSGFIVIGRTNSFGAGHFDFLLLKTDGTGNLIWSKTIGDILNDEGIAIQLTPDGGYALLGYGTNVHHASETWLIKTDSAGNALWSKTYTNNTISEFANSLLSTPDHGYIISARTYTAFGDIFILKCDSVGNLLWSKIYGGPDEESSAITLTPDGGLLVYGSTYSFGAGSSDLYMLKTNSYGEREWSMAYGTDQIDQCFAAIPFSDGYLLGGASSGMGSNQSAWIIRTDSIGRSGCHETPFIIDSIIPNTAVGSISLQAVPANSRDTLIVANSYQSTTTTDDACLFGGVYEKENDKIINVYPNPASTSFRISTINSITGNVSLLDISGRRVLTKMMSGGNLQEINLKNILPGIYLIVIESDSSKTFTKRVVVY